MSSNPSRVLTRLAIGLALALAACGSAKTPDVVRTELLSGPKDTITVVAFTDYECPYCKAAHQEMTRAMQAAPGTRLRVVRHHVPLPSHPHAELAARAAICVESLGGDTARMDDALFNAGSARLDPGSLEEAGAYAGVDRDKFADCLKSNGTTARLKVDLEAYMQAGAAGVPLHFVGSKRFEGAQDATTWQDVFAEAAAEAAKRKPE